MNGTDRFKFWYEPQDSPVWADLHILEANQDFLLSASNIPDALGHGYKSTMELYQLYIGEKTSKIDPFLEQILEHGKKQEPNALKDWLSKHPMFGGIQPGFLYSKQYSWLGCSLDHICLKNYEALDFKFPTQNSLLNLEIKCPFTGKIPQDISQVKVNHVIQTQYQMFCSGITESCLYYYTLGLQSGWHIKKDDEFIKHTLPLLKEFKNCVLTKKPPERGYFKRKSKPFVNEMMKKVKIFK